MLVIGAGIVKLAGADVIGVSGDRIEGAEERLLAWRLLGVRLGTL